MAPKYIVLSETWLDSLVKDAGTFAMFAGLIGLGVYLDSTAMQWTGAIVGFVALLGWAGRLMGEDRRLTLEQAKAKLEALTPSPNHEGN